MRVSSRAAPLLIAGGVLAAGLAVAAALSAGYALADNPLPPPRPAGPAVPGGPGGHGLGGFGLRAGPGLGFGPALHGDVVVQNGSGTRTVTFQRGSVTARSGQHLTVRSSDGFTLTWTLNAQTRIAAAGAQGGASGLATGDTVLATGARSGGVLTADAVVERGAGVRTGQHRWFRKPPGAGGAVGGAPAGNPLRRA